VIVCGCTRVIASMSDNIVDVKDEMKGNNVDMHVCEKYALNHKT